jgi:branched-chain amino acid transport system substrate-binding protein
MRKWFYLLLALVILAAAIPLAGVGCSSEKEEKAAYKIGAVFSTSGSQSDLGVPEQRTVEMMVEEINNDGGINGHPLEVIVYNDESDSTKTLSLVTKLIEQDNVLAIIGPTFSGGSMAILDTVKTAEIPNVSCAASIDIVTPVAERYWVFKTPQTDVQAIKEIYGYLEEQEITKIGIITDTSGYGASGRKYLIANKGDYGIEIVDDQTFTTGDTNMQSQLTHIKGTSAQAVICWATNKESAIVAQDMVTLGFTIPLFCSHGVANKAFIEQAGDAGNGVILPAGKLLVVDDVPKSDPQKKVLTNYRDDYEAIYGEGTVNTFGGHAYDALSMVVMALEEMDEDLSTADARAFIRDYIENDIKDWPGTGGVFTMSPEDHLGMAPGSLALIKIVDGEWTWLQ